MANVAMQITVPTFVSSDGRIPFLLYTPGNVSKKQPLIIYLHGIDKNSSVHNTTSILNLRTLTKSTISGVDYYTGGSGLGWLTDVNCPYTNGILPAFTDPFGESFEFYVMVPQNYSTDGTLWQNDYFPELLNWAEANLNVDKTRMYIVGYSLGGGGAVTAAAGSTINTRVAAFAGFAPGYGNTSANALAIATRGVPLYLSHAWGDETTNVCPDSIGTPCSSGDPGGCTRAPDYSKRHCGELIADQIIRLINAQKPLVPPLYIRYADPSIFSQPPGNPHDHWLKMFDPRHADLVSFNNHGEYQSLTIQQPNLYKWLLRHRKITADLPLHVPGNS